MGLLERPKLSTTVYERLFPDVKTRPDLSRIDYGLKLLQRFQSLDRGTTLIEVEVLPGLSCERTPDAWDDRLQDFGRLSLPHLQTLIAKARRCGVGWGASVAAPIRAAEHGSVSFGNLGLALFATCGDLFDHLDFENASSSLVERLHKLNGKQGTAWTLKGVPALLDDDTVRNFYSVKHNGYRTIKGTPEFMGQCDAVVTSIGTFQQSGVHAFKKALMSEWGVAETTLQRVAWGDVGGALIPKSHLSATDQAELDRINALWTGMSFENHQKIARKAADPAMIGDNCQIPGVVVFAIGNIKAESVYQLVLQHAVNRVIIDLDLATTLAAVAKFDMAEPLQRLLDSSPEKQDAQTIFEGFCRLPKPDQVALLERMKAKAASG